MLLWSCGPRHRRACLPPSAARAEASPVQHRRSGLQSPARTRADIPWFTQLRRLPTWPPTAPLFRDKILCHSVKGVFSNKVEKERHPL